jgi:predicted amidophosphoribosyltransferase
MQNKTHLKRKNEGRCTTCGKVLETEKNQCNQCLEKRKLHRLKKKQNKICAYCSEPVTDNSVFCLKCKENNRKSSNLGRERKLKEGICKDCGKNYITSNTLYCDTCRKKKSDREKRRREKFKDDNRCIRCGIDLSIFSDINTAKTKCPVCSEYKPLW